MSSLHFSRLTGRALTLGGLLWMMIYVMTIIVGLMTGELVPVKQQPLLTRVYILLWPLSSLVLCVGLLGGLGILGGRTGKWGIILFAFMGIVASIINLIVLPLGASYPNGSPISFDDLSNSVEFFSSVLGTFCLGSAAWRTYWFPRSLVWTLIGIGIGTVPIFFLTPLPMGPDWVTDRLSFLLSGIGYTMVGVKLLIMDRKALWSV